MATRDFLLERMEHFLRMRLSGGIYSGENDFRPALTISRECGTGMETIGCALVEYLSDVDDSTELGWALFDQGMLGKIIEEHDLHKTVLPFLTEETKFSTSGDLEQALNHSASDWTLFNYVANAIRHICAMGNAIVVGRAGNFVTVDMINTFHVRLVGSLEKRVQHTANRHSISIDRAAELVRETDKSRRRFVARYVRDDLDSPRFYHLVLNTDDISPDMAARIVGDSLLEWAYRKRSAYGCTQ